jgi:hypothetical protein
MNLNMQEVMQGLRNYSLAPRPQGNGVRTTEFQQNGQLLRHTFDQQRSVGRLDVAPVQATSQSLRGQTSNLRQRHGGKVDSSFPDYKIRSASFFTVGRAFLVLWAEPAGGDATTAVSKFEVVNQLGQRVHSKARRFVVIREGQHYCHALPISTYGGRGVAKSRVVKSEHAIIHTGQDAPAPHHTEIPKSGEAPMRPIPIRVDWDNRSERLDPMSRINFGGAHLIQHNIKTKSLGNVHKNSLAALKMQFINVFNQQPVAAGPSSDREQTRTNWQNPPSVGMMYGGSALVAGAAVGAAATEGNDEESGDEDAGEVENEEDDDEGNEEDESEEEEEDEEESEDGDEDEDEDEEATAVASQAGPSAVAMRGGGALAAAAAVKEEDSEEEGNSAEEEGSSSEEEDGNEGDAAEDDSDSEEGNAAAEDSDSDSDDE